MRKVVISLLLLAITLGLLPSPVQAVGCSGLASGADGNVPTNATSHTITFAAGAYTDGSDYEIRIVDASNIGRTLATSPVFTPGSNSQSSNSSGNIQSEGNTIRWTVTADAVFTSGSSGGIQPGGGIQPVVNDFGNRKVVLYRNGGALCDLGQFRLSSAEAAVTDGAGGSSCEVYIWQERGGKQCYAPSCMTAGNVPTQIEFRNVKGFDGKPYTGPATFNIHVPGPGFNWPFDATVTNGVVKGEDLLDNVTTHQVSLKNNEGVLCPPVPLKTSETDCGDICGGRVDLYKASGTQANFEVCEQVSDATAKTECQKCMGGNGTSNYGIWTAIGCIPTAPQSIIRTIITLGLGIGGGITLLLILAGAFQLSVSSGDAQKTQEAREQITSAVIGLLFIIFSITILRFIGVQFLQLPGFGGQ